MKNDHSKDAKYSRRGFLTRSALLSAPLLSAGLSSGFAASKKGARKPYKVVEGWPKKGYPQVKSRGIDADGKGRIYVAGDKEHPVIMVSPEGKYLGDLGKGVLVAPHGVRVQNDTVWVTDLERQQVLQFSLDGKLIRAFGEKGVAGDGPEQFNRPTDFAFGPDGAIYISDGYKNTRVVCLAPDGSIRKIWGEKGTGPSQFNLVHAIAIDKGGRVYVGDRNNARVQIFDLEGKYITEWKDLGKPYGLYACDDGSIFVCGVEPADGKFRVLKVSSKGKVRAEFGETGEGPGQFKMAHSVYVDKSGAVIVADGSLGRIQKFARS